MSRIFEALERAGNHGQARARHLPGELTVAPDPVRPALPVALAAPVTPAVPAAATSLVLPRISDGGMEDEMLQLYHRIGSIFPGSATRLIQFMASRSGEGTSAIVREFARVSAMRFRRRVLLLEMSTGVVARSQSSGPSRIGDSSLYLAPFPYDVNATDRSNELRELSETYDLILVDSPAATASPAGLAFCGQADGVVLVLEADKTRAPVVQRVKDHIEKSGGRVLGVVFNKRRYYIPPFIYRRL